MNAIMTTTIHTPVTRFLRIHDVIQKIGFKKSWIYKKVGEGQFPRPARIGGAARWLESDIDTWILESYQASSNTVNQ